YDAGKEAINKLVTIIIYAALINVFFVGLEFFVGFYSDIPGHKHTLQYLFFGLEHHGHMYNNLVPYMWGFVVLFIIGITLLCVSFWLDKGVGFVLGGFVPTPLEEVVEYYPNVNEIFITIGVWAMGAFILTVLYKIAIDVEHEIEA
ncbi:MAG: menaquinol oxidoreductase, partial [Deltaproteobacteria bacterium]|nr:menaquinol oxidoreductase [Deltaproteobacteria bacterium]